MILILQTAALLACVSCVDHISKAYDAYRNRSTLEIESPLPTLSSEQKQNKQIMDFYSKMNMTGMLMDPSLSAEFSLGGSRAKMSSSIWILSEVETQYLIEVSVDIQNHPETHLPQHTGNVFVEVIDRTVGSVLSSLHVVRHNIVVLPSQSEKLLQIKSRLDASSEDAVTAVTLRVHKKPSPAKYARLDAETKDLMGIINQMHDQGVSIFLDSLQDWSLIERSAHLYSINQSDWRLKSIIQLVAFVAIAALELLYLLRIVKNDIII